MFNKDDLLKIIMINIILLSSHSSQSDGGSMAYSPSRGMRSPQVPSTGVLSPQVPSPSRRYPTHQPQYAGLGLMPPVHLQRPERHLLSDRNTSMLTSPVTVKIAPPDVLKPPVPRYNLKPGVLSSNVSLQSELTLFLLFSSFKKMYTLYLKMKRCKNA